MAMNDIISPTENIRAGDDSHIRVFRVEHPDDGRGPFERFFYGADEDCLGDYLAICAPGSAAEPLAAQSAAAYPAGRSETGDWRFACLSVDGLRLYFSAGASAAEMLNAYGYVVAEYEVTAKNTIADDHQVVFRVSSATHVTDQSPLSAFNIESRPEDEVNSFTMFFG
jgi:hypothetical protein